MAFFDGVLKKNYSTTDRWRMAVCAQLSFGKNEMIFKILIQNTFVPNSQCIFYFYQHDPPKFRIIWRETTADSFKFSFEKIPELHNCLLEFDYSCEDIFNNKEFSKLATAG